MGRPQTSSNGQIQKRQPTGADKLAGMLQRMGPELAKALPRHVDADRMARVAVTALRTTKNLGECSPASFLGCVMQAAQLGMEPNTPLQLCWLIPRKSRGQYECTLIIGYQGMMELAMRSGMISAMYAYVVREGDQFSVRLGLDPDLQHVPSDDADRESRPITHVYAVAKVKGADDAIFVCLSRAQVEARRARSDGYMYQKNKGGTANPWFTDEEAMFQKTALRALWKWLPKSAEMARAVAVDEAGATDGPQFDPEVTDALQQQGIETPIDTTAEPVEPAATDYDPETGEVSEAGS